MTTQRNTFRYIQADPAQGRISQGDFVEIEFDPNGQDLYFDIFSDCNGIAFQETLTQDLRFQYVFGEKLTAKPKLAALQAGAKNYRRTFETAKGTGYVLLNFGLADLGSRLSVTYDLPEQEPFTRYFIEENAARNFEKIAA